MINLLESNLSADEVVSLLQKGRVCRLMPPMDAPEWEAAKKKPAVQKWMKSIQALVGIEAFEPLPPLPDDLYALFYKTGERLPFESVYFERRRRLARVAMTVLLGDEETRSRFASALIGKIEETMAEESWTFPAHAWSEPAGKDPFKIDLFAAETANLMGELLNLFGSIIPGGLSRRIRRRLREQFFENYLHPRSEITWKQLPQNWNAVCHQGVIGAALAVEEDLELIAAMLVSAGECLRIFLGGFGGDGSTSEGPGYWSYGFGRFAELNCQIETATGGALSLFGNSEHVRRIALFAPALVFSNGYMVNFSDGNRHGRLGASLLAYLGTRLDLPALREESAAIFRHEAATAVDLHSQRCDTFHLTRLFLRCPETFGSEQEPRKPDVFFSDYGAVVARGTDSRGNLLEFAAKAGCNAEHHNHNDCGSFILNLNGEPAILEIGSPEYVGAYFSSDATRYTFLAARSLGHSVPLVNGCEQHWGAEFAAEVMDCELGSDRTMFVIDLTKCYPAAARCRKLIRTFVFEKASGSLRVSDAFELEEPGSVESMMICGVPCTGDGAGVLMELPGGTVRVSPVGETVFSGAEPCTYRDHGGNGSQIHRLRFRPSQTARTSTITCEIIIL